MRYSIRNGRAWAAGLLLLSAMAACADANSLAPAGAASDARHRAAAQEALFTLAPDAVLAQEQRARLEAVRGRATSGEVHVARLGAAPGAMLAPGRAVVLNVGPGKRFVALAERVAQRGPVDVSWAGPLQNAEGWVDLVLTEKGVTGALQVGAQPYSIEPLGGGLLAVVRVDRGGLPPDHSPGYEEGPSPAGAVGPGAALAPAPGAFSLGWPEGAGALGQVTAANTSGIWHDVLVVYTASVSAAYYDVPALIQLAIDQTNQSYQNSGIALGVALAGSAQVSYSEAGRSHQQHIDAAMNGSDGMMDNVPGLRNSTRADVVVVLVNDGEACGRAAAIPAGLTNTYAVVHYSCISSNNYSFQHEIGHLQGARHDRAVDNSSSPYAYGHGYVAPSKAWRTIMAYPNACNDCTRLNYWSNPAVTYNGVAMGTSTYENNARVLGNTKYTVRDFRTLPHPSNVTHTNPGVPNVAPALSWSPVTGAERYDVYGCIVNNGSYYYESCFAPTGGGTGTTWQNYYPSPSQTGSLSGSYNCPRIAMYRVRTFSRHGLSGAGTQINICVY